MSLLSRFQAWRARRAHLRLWPLEDRIEQARRMIRVDADWMGHDPTARALCERHLALISDDWYTTQFEDVATLRRRLRLEQSTPREPMPPVPADPMDWPLPCDVVIGGGTLRKGVRLRTLVERTKVLYRMATGSDADEVASRTPEERARRFRIFQDRIFSDPLAPTDNPTQPGKDDESDDALLQTR